jgi:hypothetical protein
LRSRTSLIQIIGRAARHEEGQVIMYGEKITDSMQAAIQETEDRREIQMRYNLEHGIVPKSTSRELKTIADDVREEIEKDENFGKAGAELTVNGFEEIKIESRYGGGGQGRKNAGRIAKESRSVHGGDRTERTSMRGKQVYDMFEDQKNQYISELTALNLSKAELKSRLQIAIDAMDFEMAAAIRDILK